MLKATILLCIAVALLSVSASGAVDPARLHPSLRPLLLPSAAATQFPFGGAQDLLIVPVAGGEPRLRVLLKARRDSRGPTFLGIPVLASTGTIIALQVSVSELLALAASPEVVYVEPAWKTHPTLDRSLPAIGADLLHSAVPPVLGEGVLVGAVDTGIDYTHLDFRYDGDGDGIEESSRILMLWDQTDGLVGRRYTRSEIEVDLASGAAPGEGVVRQRDSDGHGTLVMSVAAGDGSSSGGTLVGVAPGAEILVVKTTFFTTEILAGVAYLFDEAERAGRPAVVNLSLGGHTGPHDGTSLFEQGLDELSQGEGRVVVVSAGNEGDETIHVARSLRSGGSATFAVEPQSDTLDLELWYPGDAQFTLTATPPAGGPVQVATGSTASRVTPSGSIYIDNASAGPSPVNGDHSVSIRLTGLATQGRWTFLVAAAAGAGRLDGWITSFRGGSIVDGDASLTVDEPGNATRVITVGSFNTKNRWTSASGPQDFSGEYPLGQLSSFSSRGPTRDGRQKPEITAPGAWIAGALSASAGAGGYLTLPDGTHRLLLGTSFSAPHVAGTVAQMLSVDRDLTAEEIRVSLVETARSDGEVGSVPNPLWGWGKLDAQAAVAAVRGASPGEPLFLDVESNPTRTQATFHYRLPTGAREGFLQIFSVAGEPVFESRVDLAGGTFRWDLRDDQGMRLANGLYFVVLVSGGRRSDVLRLVIAR